MKVMCSSASNWHSFSIGGRQQTDFKSPEFVTGNEANNEKKCVESLDYTLKIIPILSGRMDKILFR